MTAGPDGAFAAEAWVLDQVAAHPGARAALVLRGGLLTRALVHPAPRGADDVDFLALDPTDLDAAAALLADALGTADLSPEIIWVDTAFPGLRCRVPTPHGAVQVDVGFGDPLVPPPTERTVLGASLWAARAESMVAWKLHGLFELDDLSWRPKDLHDLWLLLRHGSVDPGVMGDAIAVAFTSRDAPFRLTDRLLDGRFGRSRGSRSRWRRFHRAHPERRVPDDLAGVVADVGARLRPWLHALRAAEPAPPTFPEITHIDEVEEAIADDPAFARYRWPGLQVLTYERKGRDVFPPPAGAATHTEHRRRLLRRECRGLVFGDEGRLLSRKLHTFFDVDDPAGLPSPLRAVEKLDGSMVATLGPDRLVTRRGPSDLADAAWAFATDQGGFTDLFAHWTTQGHTVVLEWCAAAHRIVLRHPIDRLVLLAIRHDRTGAYVPWDELVRTASRHRVPVPRTAGLVDPVTFVPEAVKAAGHEGWVLVADDGRRWKVKTHWYRRRHRAREGPQPERAALDMVLEGLADEVDDLLEGRAGAWLADVDRGLAELGERLDSVASLDRRALARAVEDWPTTLARAAFRTADGLPDALRVVLRQRLGQRHGTADVRALLGLPDGGWPGARALTP